MRRVGRRRSGHARPRARAEVIPRRVGLLVADATHVGRLALEPVPRLPRPELARRVTRHVHEAARRRGGELVLRGVGQRRQGQLPDPPVVVNGQVSPGHALSLETAPTRHRLRPRLEALFRLQGACLFRPDLKDVATTASPLLVDSTSIARAGASGFGRQHVDVARHRAIRHAAEQVNMCRGGKGAERAAAVCRPATTDTVPLSAAVAELLANAVCRFRQQWQRHPLTGPERGQDGLEMLLRLEDLRGHGGGNGDAQFGQPRREAVFGRLVVGRLDAHQRTRCAAPSRARGNGA